MQKTIRRYFQPFARCNRRTVQRISLRMRVMTGSWSDDSEEKTVHPVPFPVGTKQPQFSMDRRGCPRLRLPFGNAKGEQGDCPRSLDGHGQLPLMFCAVSRDPAWHDLASLRSEIAERLRVLVFNFQVRVRAEATEFSPMEELFLWSRSPAGASGCRCRRHDQFPPFTSVSVSSGTGC